MEYLKIDEAGIARVVKGQNPEDDEDLLRLVADGEMTVIRYRGNQFEQLSAEADIEEESFDCSWEAVTSE